MPELDLQVTPVVFRMWEKEVIALFPTLTGSEYYCLSYMHIGQHGDADYSGIVAKSRSATPKEYADLFEELTSIGYNLKVYQRRPSRR